MFNEFNKKYFKNSLPKNTCIRFKKLNHLLGRATKFKRETNFAPIIEIDSDIKNMRCVVAMVLLHEMVHIENFGWRGHGYKFHRRMLRLAKDGAFNPWW